MVDLQQYMIRGFRDDPFLRDQILDALAQVEIGCEWSLDSSGSFYYVAPDMLIHRTDRLSRQGQELMLERQIISPDEFLVRIREVEFPKPQDDHWYENLKVGDVVTIAKRYGTTGLYPIGFGDVMAEHAGREYVIEEIRENYIGKETISAHRRFFNGDYRKYKLKGLPFGWHSSMFVPQVLDPSMRLEIVEIPLLKLL